MGSLIAFGAAALLAAVAPPADTGRGSTPAADESQGTEKAAEKAAAEKKQLEEEIAKELGQSASEAPPPPAPVPAAQGQTGGSALARVLLLPDISAIGSASLHWQTFDPALSPRAEAGPGADHRVVPVFDELELAVQSVVDPYARADIFISFAPEGVSVEEAYLTTLSLPAGLQIRAGTLKSPFGRINQQHPHIWDFVGAPLALTRIVSPDQLNGPGADLAWLAPVPWFAELHLAYQVTAPALPALPADAGTRDGRTAVARLVQFFDLTDSATLGVGVSAARVSLPGDGARDDLAAADLFLKIRPPTTRAYLAVQAELFGRRIQGPHADGGRLGGYAQAVWRTGPFWAWGLRYDDAPGAVSGVEQRWSALMSYIPSEFSRFRLQAGLDQLPGGGTGWEAVLAMEFAIGAHGAHPF